MEKNPGPGEGPRGLMLRLSPLGKQHCQVILSFRYFVVLYFVWCVVICHCGCERKWLFYLLYKNVAVKQKLKKQMLEGCAHPQDSAAPANGSEHTVVLLLLS